MSVFAEFHVPTEAFALQQTFHREPDTVVEIERVVATDELLTPYFWVTDVDFDSFRAAVDADPSVEDLVELDTFGETALYRGDWTENVETLVYAYTQVGAVIFEATGSNELWELRMRFNSRDALREFQSFCVENDLPFELQRLHELANPRTSSQYGLTEKQQDALVTAWKAGYFDTPRQCSLAEVADELDISQQALSDRLRRGHHSLIASTLTVTPPEDES